jgi:hypothetical protein
MPENGLMIGSGQLCAISPLADFPEPDTLLEICRRRDLLGGGACSAGILSRLSAARR